MADFDKDKKHGFGFGFGVVVGVVVGATSFLANVSEIVQLFNKDNKPEKTENPVSVVEPVEKDVDVTDAVIGTTYVIKNGDDYAEAVAEIADKEDLCIEEAEETLIQQAYVVDYNEPVFIEDTATYGDYFMTFKENDVEETVIEQAYVADYNSAQTVEETVIEQN